MKCEIELDDRMKSASSKVPVSLWLVDDNDELRGVLAENFWHEEGIACSRQFQSAEAVIEALKRETPPDVILMDVNMQGMSGIEAIAPIKQLAPTTRVLMLTTFFDSLAASKALRDGASGFLLKSYDFSRIAECVESREDVWPETWLNMKAGFAKLEIKRVESPVTVTSKPAKHFENPLAQVIRFFQQLLRLSPGEASTVVKQA